MCGTLLTTSLLLLGAATAAAQPPSRFTLGPVARLDRVSIDGHTTGTTPVAGVAASVRVSKAIAVEGELTGAAQDIARSYEGWFISYAQGPNVSREEAERLAPTARRRLDYEPGAGVAGMIVARTAAHARISVSGRLGASARRYTERSDYNWCSRFPRASIRLAWRVTSSPVRSGPCAAAFSPASTSISP